jgi:3'-phosphoadenosine 5'-phosphosulfate sulfotransferase (PAPS reductase)/FAD synthetase
MINVIDLYRDSRWDGFARQNIRNLPLDDPNLCCYLHKVQPMQKALKDLKAWISGIRRDQTRCARMQKFWNYKKTGC